MLSRRSGGCGVFLKSVSLFFVSFVRSYCVFALKNILLTLYLDDAPVIEVNDDDEEQFAYAQRMKRARERNAARWKEYDIDGKVIIKEEDHGADLSPPRSRGNDADLSPPRSRGGADISPPRSIKTEDLSPPRSRSADMSPPRVRVKREPGTDDFSPPRGVGGDTDMSPPRRHSTAGDMSPPRRARSDTADLSPNRDLSPARRKPRTLEGGGRAGLFLGDDAAKEEEEMKKRKMEQLKRMDPTASGMGAATVYRDRRGKILPGLTQMIAQEEGKRIKCSQLTPEGKTYEDASTNYDWGVGRRDIEAEVALKRREEEESGRGYRGIGRDDERLNEEKREQDRFGDPMVSILLHRRVIRLTNLLRQNLFPNRRAQEAVPEET